MIESQVFCDASELCFVFKQPSQVNETQFSFFLGPVPAANRLSVVFFEVAVEMDGEHTLFSSHLMNLSLVD